MSKKEKLKDHEHCVGCECILRWDESEKYCRSCEELIKKGEFQ